MAESSQFRLLAQRRFGPFFGVQFLGAMTKPWRLRPFAKIGLAVGDPVPTAAATPERLQGQVLALRGEWR